MSRAKIGAVVAVIVAVLTLAAYLLVAGRLDAAVRREVDAKVDRSRRLLTQIALLESFDIISSAKAFSLDEAVRRAIEEPATRDSGGKEAVKRFLAGLEAAGKPDFVAVVDAKGAAILSDSPLPDAEDFRRFKAVAAAIDSGQYSKDVWDIGKNTVRVGVSPVIGAGGAPVGAVIVAHAIANKEAVEHAALVGTDIVYFTGNRVLASSFGRNLVEDLGKHEELSKIAHDAAAGQIPKPTDVTIGDASYVASAGALPANFENRTSGALVLASLDAERARFTAVKVIIIVLGIGALLIALLAMWVTSRLIFHQSDQIEAGVAEIINGDVDYTFKPVGADFDGLANSLNVMLARLLGRPEPGDELAEEGSPARVLLDDEQLATNARVSQDPDVVALANEPEADYLRRVHAEYVAARRANGEAVEGVTFESFSAKLRLSEANLRKKYNCKAVRFRVQTKDNQVTLKPVPIL